jgi:hypothetical protein
MHSHGKLVISVCVSVSRDESNKPFSVKKIYYTNTVSAMKNTLLSDIFRFFKIFLTEIRLINRNPCNENGSSSQ